MSIWTRISEALAALASGESLSDVFARLKSPPERSVAFTIAIISLGAKMAKADGEVSRTEVSAFRCIFAIPPGEEANAARVFNLARQDVAGFEHYARKIARMFDHQKQVRIDILEGLFHVAVADGGFHPAEDAFLTEVARIFGLGDACYRAIRARVVPGAPRDPYDVLGVDHGAPISQVRNAWKKAVRESHPDRMIARGVPPEAIRLAERRLIDINIAWEEINAKQAA